MTNVVPLDVARFWVKVEMPSPASCWTWQGAGMGRDGAYGRFDGRPAHRFAYEMHCGPIPDGMMVRHLCGNKKCVNPKHLDVGTAKENFADRYVLGEGLGPVAGRGEANLRAKLTEEQARYILANPDKLSGAKLARKFGVSPATISLMRSGKRWAHVKAA